MLPGILGGIIYKTGAPGGAPLARTGTAQEDETQTASGGSGSYDWVRLSDSAVVGTGSSYTYTASDVGEQIDLDDGVSTVAGTEVGSSALAWFSAADYAAGEIQNRGVMTHPVADDSLGGPAVGTDDLGPYCDFNGVDGMQTTAAEIPAYGGSAFTVYCLADTPTGSASTFSGEMYQTGERISVRHLSGGTIDLLITNEGYETYGNWAADAAELACYVLDGTTGARYGYRDAEIITGVGATPNGFDGNVDFSFGGLFSGVQAPDGKLRFLAFYPSAHDATKRAEVRAALKRVWAHVDTIPEEWTGAQHRWTAEDVNVTGSNIDQFNDTIGSADLIPKSGDVEATLETDFYSSGKPYADVPGTNTTYENLILRMNGGVAFEAWSHVAYLATPTPVNGAETYIYFGTGSNPRLRHTATSTTFDMNVGQIGITDETAPMCTVGSYDYNGGTDSVLFIAQNDEVIDGTASNDVHDDDEAFELFRDSIEVEFVEITLFNRALTKTEALLALCYGQTDFGVTL